MEKSAITVRPMKMTDLGEAMKLSTTEGWNQTEKDWNFLLESPENVCLVAEKDEQVIGTISAINYSDKISWIGMVLVDRQHRGLGVAKSLMEEMIQQTGAIPFVKLDATPAGQQVYNKLGFTNEYPIVRMTGNGVPGLEKNRVETALPIQTEDIDAVIALDASVFGVRRPQLINFLASSYSEMGWVLKDNNQLVGFALGRDGNRFKHIGPVVAASAGDTTILISAALSRLQHRPVVIDVLCDKNEVIDALTSVGFARQREFMRMFKGRNSFTGSIRNSYCITGPEFG